MAAKPDLVMPIAKGLAELINARPSSPSLAELRAHLPNAYLSAMSTTAKHCPVQTWTRMKRGVPAAQ